MPGYFDASYFDSFYFDTDQGDSPPAGAPTLRYPTRRRGKDYSSPAYYSARPGGKNPTR